MQPAGRVRAVVNLPHPDGARPLCISAEPTCPLHGTRHYLAVSAQVTNFEVKFSPYTGR